jgi:hypothetical protein
MNEVENQEVESIETKGVRFANDLSDELKARVKDETVKRIEALLEQEDFSVNDIAKLAGVAHGSIKGRAKTLTSAEAIITAVLDGTRAAGGTRKPSTDSIKSFIDSLDNEAKAKFLAELGLAQA